VRDGPSVEQDYLRLLDACEALAVAVGMPNLLAGANMARHEAYRDLLARGFRTAIQGVAMHRHNDPGYCRPGAYIIDDLALIDAARFAGFDQVVERYGWPCCLTCKA
jgi:hypothetical protein